MTKHEDLFMEISRKKLTISTSKGIISIHDCWDLPLKYSHGLDLNEIAIALDDKTAKQKDFVDEDVTTEESDAELAFKAILKIIEIKKQEQQDAKSQADKKVKRQAILAALKARENDSLNSMSEKQLKKMLDEL